MTFPDFNLYFSQLWLYVKELDQPSQYHEWDAHTGGRRLEEGVLGEPWYLPGLLLPAGFWDRNTVKTQRHLDVCGCTGNQGSYEL